MGTRNYNSIAGEALWVDDACTQRRYATLDRDFWQTWTDEGACSIHTRCIEMKDEILRTHIPEPLDEDTDHELEKIVDAAWRHLTR